MSAEHTRWCVVCVLRWWSNCGTTHHALSAWLCESRELSRGEGGGGGGRCPTRGVRVLLGGVGGVGVPLGGVGGYAAPKTEPVQFQASPVQWNWMEREREDAAMIRCTSSEHTSEFSEASVRVWTQDVLDSCSSHSTLYPAGGGSLLIGPTNCMYFLSPSKAVL